MNSGIIKEFKMATVVKLTPNTPDIALCVIGLIFGTTNGSNVFSLTRYLVPFFLPSPGDGTG